MQMLFFQDFGDMIPGHGGIMDRFDCQFLMATFVNVYISSFIRIASPQKLLALVSIAFTEFGYVPSRNFLSSVLSVINGENRLCEKMEIISTHLILRKQVAVNILN